MSETKEESNSATSDVKMEEDSPKDEEIKGVDESSKDSEKDSVKDDSIKEESGKEGSDKDESDEDDEEEGMGLLDRPVEVTGCRARKKVERLEVSFNAPKEKQEIQEGKGQKLGDCPRIEHQVQKTSIEDLKPLHRILFGRLGSAAQIKKNIRKFSGFPFEKNSPEFDRKKAVVEKLTTTVLKRVCEMLDLERSGTKEEIVMRVLEFCLSPKESGKRVKSKKKTPTKDKKKVSEKKPKNNKKLKTKKEAPSDEDDSANESASEELSLKGENDEDDDDEDDESDYDSKKKSKSPSKPKKTPSKTAAKKTEKKERAKKEDKKTSKGAKRKRDEDDSDSSDEEPIAKKSKMPSDEEIKKLVKRILDAADLQEITMKKVIKQIADAYPDCDLSHKKAFIKTTIKSVIS